MALVLGFGSFPVCSEAPAPLAEAPTGPGVPGAWGKEWALLDLALAALNQGERFHQVESARGGEGGGGVGRTFLCYLRNVDIYSS